AFDEGDFVANLGEIVFFAAGKIIEDDHAVPALDEFVHRIRADETGAAGHQIAHRGNLLRSKLQALYSHRGDSQHVGGQVAPAIPRARPGKTLHPRFDTLIVAARRRGSRMISACSKILYDGNAASTRLFRGNGSR